MNGAVQDSSDAVITPLTRRTSPVSRGALREVAQKPMVRHGSGVKNHRMHEVKLSDGIITLSPLRLDDVEAHLAREDELLVRWLNGGPGTREGVVPPLTHMPGVPPAWRGG